MLTYPDAPGFKEKGGCSEEAAKLLAKKGRAADLRQRCLNALRINPFGRTCNELAGMLDEPVTSIRPRISELNKTDLIEKVGTRKLDESHMAVWRLTDAGKGVANEV